MGKWETLYDEGEITLLAVGRMVQQAVLVREKLRKSGIKIGVVNANFVKPLDISLLKHLVYCGKKIVTLEDNVLHGGFGSMVLEYINTLNKETKVINLGFKDEFIPHGGVDILYKNYGLDVDGIIQNIVKLI